MKPLNAILLLLAVLLNTLSAQDIFPVNGVFDNRTGTYLLENATIVPGENRALFVGDILIKEGKIKNVAPSIEHKGAVVVDLEGYYVYPSFIDLYAQYGIENLTKNSNDGYAQFVSDKPGAYGWNEAIRSEFRAHEAFKTNNSEAGTWRSLGFGTVLTHRKDGISRGTGSLVALNNRKEHEVIIKEVVSHHLSLSKGTSSQDYPGSQMGGIALLKQTYLDGQWYAKGQDDVNISLEKWNELQTLPTIIEAPGLLGVFRVDKIGDEFGKQYIIKGSGAEYRRIDDVKATNASFIIPVNYPETYDVEDPWDAEHLTLAKMKHWELAVYNLQRMHESDITFSITTHGLKEKKNFLKNVRLAIEKGLDEGAALNALTINPAKQIGVSDQVGSITTGKWANVIVSDKPVFESDAKILQNWVMGEPHQINAFKATSIDAAYDLKVGDQQYNATIEKSAEKPKLTLLLSDTTNVEGNLTYHKGQVTISFALPEEHEYAGYTTLSGWVNNDMMKGSGRLADGSKVKWTAVRSKGLIEEAKAEEEKDAEKKDEEAIGKVIYPFIAFGWQEKPNAEKVLFKNATVWTNEADGIRTNTDVLIEDGKIKKVGKNLSGNDVIIVDATGKHLTNGIIDEHAHIGIQGGVNEWTQASSAEVSIADVVNSEDVNIYRQLAGGVIAAQLLHGSANPIGGQSAIIKFRWGSLPEEMKIAGADGFIKFALGENVKKSNWGDKQKTRYPQTRMGVEQVFNDHFTRAKEYHADTDVNKRKDLEMEALAEILNKERFITCHSYVQSEINMLMKVAESFGFRVNTFTHILEGYKLADKMVEHGAGGSTFSDWWAYKFEVIDAIPHNAAILNSMGVVTAINSDDAEMGRRLNQEAAKAVKYGGMSEEDAWKMVTLNPAKLLHLDEDMGSIKKGKDADIVLWSDNPLSIYAKAEQTYVDGIKYYDIEDDAKKRKWLDAERARLVQKMLVAKKGGAKTVKPSPVEEKHYHCDDIELWNGLDD